MQKQALSLRLENLKAGWAEVNGMGYFTYANKTYFLVHEAS